MPGARSARRWAVARARRGDSDPACASENFYSCPGPGCELYTINVDSASYKPNGMPSACTPYGGATDYTQPYPPRLDQLAYASDSTVVQTQIEGASTPYPHQIATNEPSNLCPTNAPSTPDWPPAPGSAIPQVFTVGIPATTNPTPPPDTLPLATVSISNPAPISPINIPGNGAPLYSLAQGNYTFTATATPAAKCTPGDGHFCSCQQNFTVTSTGWTSSGHCCNLGGSPTNLNPSAPDAWSCAGP